jgi:hypothetical protein
VVPGKEKLIGAVQEDDVAPCMARGLDDIKTTARCEENRLLLAQPLVRSSPRELIPRSLGKALADSLGQLIGAVAAKGCELRDHGSSTRVHQIFERLLLSFAKADSSPKLLLEHQGLSVVIAMDVRDKTARHVVQVGTQFVERLTQQLPRLGSLPTRIDKHDPIVVDDEVHIHGAERVLWEWKRGPKDAR